MRFQFLAIFVWGVFLGTSFGTPEKYTSGIPALDIFLKSYSGKGVVVGMTGFYGQDQPRQWLILVKDPENETAMSEYVISDGRITAQRKVRVLPGHDFPSIEIPRSKLKVDSSLIFTATEELASAKGVGYDSVHYQLRCRDENHEPVWMVNLLDPARNSVGIQYISAVTGKILRSVWHPANPTSMSRSSTGVPQTKEKFLYGRTASLEETATPKRRVLKQVIVPTRIR